MHIFICRSYVEVFTDTRTAALTDVFFPSLVVCNVSPLRKSFMYDVLEVLLQYILEIPWERHAVFCFIYSFERLTK